jgi:hypothetical protein
VPSDPDGTPSNGVSDAADATGTDDGDDDTESDAGSDSEPDTTDDEVPPDEDRCIALTRDGERCSRRATEGSDYCKQHAP